MPTTTPAPDVVERTSQQPHQTQRISHRVRNLVITGVLVVAVAVALFIWALVSTSSARSHVNPAAPGTVQRIGLGDFPAHGMDPCVVTPGTHFC